jgi:hypothetical protein
MLWVVACVVRKILYHQSTNRDCLLLLTFGFEFEEDGLLQGPRGTQGFFTPGKDGQSSFTGWVKLSLLQHFDKTQNLLQIFFNTLTKHKTYFKIS